jgi:cytochrome c oxidase subunit 1
VTRRTFTIRTFTVGVPLLWLLGGVAVLAMTVLTEIAVTAALKADRGLQETYYVVMHRERAIEVAAIFAVFAGWYNFFTRITGWTWSTRLARLHFWLFFIGVMAWDFPNLLALVDVRGFVRHPDTYSYAFWVSAIGVCLAAAGMLVFFIAMALALRRRQRAGP